MKIIARLLLAGSLWAAGSATVLAQPAAPDAPRPLAKHTIVKFGVTAKNETLAALVLADSLGELAKENIELKYFVQRPSDALVLLSTGRLDVIGDQLGANFMNAVASGVNVKMVAPTWLPTPDSKFGFWVSRAWLNGRTYSPALLKGVTVASPAGPGSVVDYGVAKELVKANLTIKDVNRRSLGIADLLPALENGAIQVALLFDGVWQKGDPAKVQFAWGFPSDIVGGFFYGPTLLDEQRDVGAAVMRAMVRTVKTYLQGDYRNNPKVAPALASAMGISVERLQSSGGLKFNPEMPIPDYAAATLQKLYFEMPNVLTYKEPLPDNRVIDRSFAESSNGKK